jgi:hypothetical protein
MADSQQIQKLIESVVAKVFDRRISELRKDLHRSVGESLSSRVSELQHNVETGVAEAFGARLAEIRMEVETGMSQLLEGRANDVRKEVDRSASEVIQRRTAEVREHVGQGVSALLDERISGLRKGIEEGLDSAIAKRVNDLRKDVEELVQEVAGKRIANLRRDTERVVEETAEGRIEELRKDIVKTVTETAERRIGDMRKDVEKLVSKTAEDRMGRLRKDVERIVAEVAEKRIAGIRKDLEGVVAEAGEQRLADLRKELVATVAQEMEASVGGKAAQPAPSTQVDSAVASIQQSDSQSDILRALLDGAAHFAARVGLFVVKENTASGWQARGFADNNAVKKVSVHLSEGLAARVVEKRSSVNAPASDFDSGFAKSMGHPANGNCVVFPLMVRERVPALIYADAGNGGRVDLGALQLLVRTAGLWLEVVTLRKLVGETDEAEGEQEVAVAAAAVAGPPPATARAAAAPASKPAASKPAAAPARPVNADDEEVHKKARRFAKLLVDEIKLYNQGKVAEGRQHRDLYDRLKEDIEKSRASYEKRYGNTAAADGNYFTQEVIRILAENDASILGRNFPQ